LHVVSKILANKIKNPLKNVLRKADKSNAVVIMDKDKYNDNMQKLIDDGPYELMTSNPIPRLIEKAKKLSQEIIETMNLSSFWK
jgi:hypothetical protein